MYNITQSYEPRTNGAPRVGSALIVGRVAIPSDLVEGGTKGKALALLHAWKARLRDRNIDGEERLPRPRLFRGSPSEDDTRDEWAGKESKVIARAQSKIVENGDAPKKLSQGAYSRRLHEYCHLNVVEVSNALLECIPVTLSLPRSFSIPPRHIYFHIIPFNSQAVSTLADIKHRERWSSPVRTSSV